jgi:hypothetical protein
MKYTSIILFFLFFNQTCQSYSQSQLYQPIQFPDTIPSKYIFNVAKEYITTSKKSVKGVKQKDIKRFAETVTYGKQELFTSGYVYMNWDELEDYVNSILQLVLPDEMKDNKSIHFYITRDASHNAFSIHDGSLFLNIGLFADVVNEAGLAIILGHELSHFINDDAKNSYLKSLKLYTKENRNNNYALILKQAKYDRTIEKRADSLGFILAEKANYDIFYGISNFMQFQEIEALEMAKKNGGQRIANTMDYTFTKKDTSLSSSLDNLLASHPSLANRITYLNRYLKSKERRAGKKSYIIDKEKFSRLQKVARLECLSVLLSQNNFNMCIERSFVYYLSDPTNANYIYYLLESMRRAIYVNEDLKSKGFLTDEFTSFKKGKSILHNLKILIADSVQFSEIKDLVLTDTSKVPFETYDDAFKYFAKIAVNNKINESLLTIALYNAKNDTLCKNYLKEYLACDSILYKDFASALLQNSLYKELLGNNKQIILFDDITFLEDHFYGYHNRLILAEKRMPSYIKALSKMMKRKFPEKELVQMSKLSAFSLRTKLEYEAAIIATTYSLNLNIGDKYEDQHREYIKKTDSSGTFDVFLFDPDYWSLYKEKKLKSLSYLKAIAFDDKTKIVKLVNVINPFYWWNIMPRIYIAMTVGSTRYAHEVSYYSYDIFSKQTRLYSNNICYKMSKAHFINSIYYALKTKQVLQLSH